VPVASRKNLRNRVLQDRKSSKVPQGEISYSLLSRSQVVRRVCEKLEQNYGRPRLGNPENAVDDLIYIALSNRSRPEIADAVYQNLKNSFPTWEEMRGAPVGKVVDILRPAGLANIRSRQLVKALSKIEADFGTCTLEPLRTLSRQDAESYLCSLPGVSTKVAKCVMMFTLGFDVLPVDVHVHRIASRLGWTSKRVADQSHTELESVVPSHRRYVFHVCCIEHGRRVCAKKPRCDECDLTRYCQYFKSK
jgi:endonuclease III